MGSGHVITNGKQLKERAGSEDASFIQNLTMLIKAQGNE